MNARFLLKHLRDRGVTLKLAGERLEVDAPPGVVTPETLSRLKACKPEILRLLADEERRRKARWERGLDARFGGRGYIRLHDPTTGEVHEFPRKDCFSSLTEDAKAHLREERGIEL